MEAAMWVLDRQKHGTNLPSSFLCGEIETQELQRRPKGADTHKEYFRSPGFAGAHQPGGVRSRLPLR